MNDGAERRSPEETRAVILEAARDVFTQQGYARATTRRIASAAGISEVTLFRHFGSKHNLFLAMLDSFAAPAMIIEMRQQLTGSLRKDMTLLGSIFMKVMLERGDYVRLMLCESTHFPELREALGSNPRLLRAMLADYLSEKIAQGELRALHPQAMAQAFLGMFYAYGISLGMLEVEIDPALTHDQIITQFVDIFISGIQLA